MDLFCQVCGEPWDIQSVEHYDFSDSERKKFHAGKGCPACKFGEKAPEDMPFRSMLASAAADILGDDIDGLASIMDDAERAFGEEFWE